MISSTVGLEALLYDKPVLTLGQPFYSGFGVTLDVDSFAEIRTKVPELLRFRPDPERISRFLHAAMRGCRPGRARPRRPLGGERGPARGLDRERRRGRSRRPPSRTGAGVSPRVVLFWDLDGTLLLTGRAGLFAFEEAVEEVTGSPRPPGAVHPRPDRRRGGQLVLEHAGCRLTRRRSRPCFARTSGACPRASRAPGQGARGLSRGARGP